MPRNLDSSFVSALGETLVRPAFLVNLTLTTGPLYVWSGVGDFVWNGNTYQGVGALGSISTISESSDMTANGVTLTLSSIPINLLGDALSDVQQGQPAQVYLALFDANCNLQGTPVCIYGGFMDAPEIDLDTKTATISLPLESWFADMNRSQCVRYTDTQQRALYPGDQSHSWINRIQDINLLWN